MTDDEAIRARAREILARQPTADEIAEHEARRLANNKSLPAIHDRDDLNRRWATGRNLSDAEFAAMNELNASAAYESRHALPAMPVAPIRPSEEALRELNDRNALLGDIRIKAASDRARKGELEAKHLSARWTAQERTEWWKLHATDLLMKVDDHVEAKDVAMAIGCVIRELAVVAIGQTLNRERLEDRIASIEAIEARRRNVEVTTVTKHDTEGRIVSFEKRLEIREEEPADRPSPKPRHRVKAPTRLSQ